MQHKKNLIKRIISYIILTVVFISIASTALIYKNKKKVENNLNVFPSFFYLTTDSIRCYSGQSNHLKSIIVLFGTDCEFCQEEAISFYRQKRELRKYNLMWITTDKIASIKKFKYLYKISDTDFKLGKISLNDRIDLFNARQIPTILLYDEKGILVRRYNGEVKPETIINCLK